MAKEIEPKLVSIGDYLKLEKDVKFIIPCFSNSVINFLVAEN